MTLSVRLDVDLQQAFELEVKRLKTTKSQYVNQLLRQALQPRDPMLLLEDIRRQYGIAEPGPETPRTNKARTSRERLREIAQDRHRARRAD